MSYYEPYDPGQYDPEEWAERVDMFQDPGSGSALRRASRENPRNQPCPQCRRPNMLTPADKRRHYVCNACADHNEGVGPDGNGDY